MTFADKLLAVANNRPKLYKKGALDYSPQETVSGEAIGITDISPVEHNMGVSVRNTNLLNEKAVTPIVINEDGWTRYGWDLGVLPQGTYTLTVFGNYVNSKSISYKTITNGVYSEYQSLIESKKSQTIALNGSQGFIVYLYQNVTELYDNVTLMLNEGTVALPYAPYIEDISTVKLYKQGKNLVSNDVYDINNWVNPSGNDYRYYFNLPVGTYTVSAEKKETVAYFYLQETTDDWVTAKSTYIITNNANNRITFTVEKGKQYAFYTQKQYFALIYNIQIEVGSSYTQYEPYIEPTIYDVSSSGIVEGVTSLYPSTTLYTDTSGAVIDCTYYQDGRKVKENLTDMILSLGGVINE